MDTLYLFRFNKSTPLAELQAEQEDLRQNIIVNGQAITDLDPIAAYSTVRAAITKQATLKAKLSYINRLVGKLEQKRNNLRTNREYPLFPPDYYGDYPY